MAILALSNLLRLQQRDSYTPLPEKTLLIKLKAIDHYYKTNGAKNLRQTMQLKWKSSLRKTKLQKKSEHYYSSMPSYQEKFLGIWSFKSMLIIIYFHLVKYKLFHNLRKKVSKSLYLNTKLRMSRCRGRSKTPAISKIFPS